MLLYKIAFKSITVFQYLFLKTKLKTLVAIRAEESKLISFNDFTNVRTKNL